MNPEDVGDLYASAPRHISFPAKVFIDGEMRRAVISARGVTTVHSPRKSFNVKLEEGDFHGAKEFRLSASPDDSSLLRTLMAVEVFSEAGVTTSWAEPAYVYLNERVLGLYIVLELVDDDFFSRRGIDWERLYSALGDADFGPTFESRVEIAVSGKPKPANIYAMLALRRTLEISDDGEFTAAIFRILDRGDVVNYMAAAQITDHFDGFNKNLFYYQLADSHLMRLAPWDYDLDWQNRSEVESWHLNYLFTRIGKSVTVRAEIQGRISTLLSGNLSEASLISRIAYWKGRIAEAYTHDPWLGGNGKSLNSEASALEQAVSARISRIQ